MRASPLLGKTIFAPFSWTLLYRGQSLAGFPAADVSPENAAARGPKELWVVPGAFHTAALGFAPDEFRRRVLAFFATYTKPSPQELRPLQ